MKSNDEVAAVAATIVVTTTITNLSNVKQLNISKNEKEKQRKRAREDHNTSEWNGR